MTVSKIFLDTCCKYFYNSKRCTDQSVKSVNAIHVSFPISSGDLIILAANCNLYSISAVYNYLLLSVQSLLLNQPILHLILLSRHVSHVSPCFTMSSPTGHYQRFCSFIGLGAFYNIVMHYLFIYLLVKFSQRCDNCHYPLVTIQTILMILLG